MQTSDCRRFRLNFVLVIRKLSILAQEKVVELRVENIDITFLSIKISKLSYSDFLSRVCSLLQDITSNIWFWHFNTFTLLSKWLMGQKISDLESFGNYFCCFDALTIRYTFRSFVYKLHITFVGIFFPVSGYLDDV